MDITGRFGDSDSMRFLFFVLLGALAFAQSNPVERFDTSGMPRRPTNFVEQQILDLIGHHKAGDLMDAKFIQRKLGRYYADKGDERRARAALLAASAADESGPDSSPVEAAPPVAREAFPSARVQSPVAPPIVGNYYGMDGRTLHTWEFDADGSFLHTWIASGAGTSVRNSERGTFWAENGALVLRLQSTATGFATPGVGNRTTAVGGGAGASGETRRIPFKFADSNLVLDGQTLKPKSW